MYYVIVIWCNLAVNIWLPVKVCNSFSCSANGLDIILLMAHKSMQWFCALKSVSNTLKLCLAKLCNGFSACLLVLILMLTHGAYAQCAAT